LPVVPRPCTDRHRSRRQALSIRSPLEPRRLGLGAGSTLPRIATSSYAESRMVPAPQRWHGVEGQRGGAAHSLAELSVRTIRFGRVVEQRSELREQQCLLRCHSRLPHSTTQRRRRHG
jgi:hypothetical protein